jgi:septum formation protein
MLARAGIPVAAMPAALDEHRVKLIARQHGLSAGALALTLAEMKAARVSLRRPDALVIGADQLLDCEGEWFDKPADLAAAALHIRRLRGRTHRLVTAACCMRQGRTVWHCQEAPVLAMRHVSDEFIARYVADEGAALLGSVGAYRLEGPGIQLFERIEGDFFTILGLPLLPVLGFLREDGLIPQ